MNQKRKAELFENEHEQKSKRESKNHYKKRMKVIDIEYQIYSCYDIPTFKNNSVLKEKD